MPTTCRLHIDVRDDDLVLQRILVVCARRRCPVTALDYARCDGVVAMSVRGSERQLATLPRWIGTLVDVIAVTAELPCRVGADR